MTTRSRILYGLLGGLLIMAVVHTAIAQKFVPPPKEPFVPPPKVDPPPLPPVVESPQGPTVGRRGTLEVTLWWETPDDLDLEIDCPGGRISPFAGSTKGPGICGDGTHDVDANRLLRNAEPHPSEHIVWGSNYPSGLYRVRVIPTMTFGGNSIHYSVRIDYDGESKTCEGTVQWEGIAGSGFGQVPIEFTPQHPLPSCQSINLDLHKCTDPSCTKQ